jgi:hypothetical protein
VLIDSEGRWKLMRLPLSSEWKATATDEMDFLCRRVYRTEERIIDAARPPAPCKSETLKMLAEHFRTNVKPEDETKA